ncbi:hypothetical protein GM3708_788 [Geminocystis sp. NIES-3708]|uniref:hypothetical protein n=1 Tax=Geminocystis sp. NIES-3708 TaxID=1615909 RepID=UPI0005FCA04C|nr:hypothetical protein [Geminocystis sp. NIES-3708]BAQ60382.1 hypothetical protein GM3708_788 [Geminocystis sp. NIES-3708]
MSTDKSTNKLTQIIEAKRQKQLERENKEKWIRDELLKMGFIKSPMAAVNLVYAHEGNEWYVYESDDYCLYFEIYIDFNCEKAEIYCYSLSVWENKHLDIEEQFEEYFWNMECPQEDCVISENGNAEELLEKILASIEKLTPEILYPRSLDPHSDT